MTRHLLLRLGIGLSTLVAVGCDDENKSRGSSSQADGGVDLTDLQNQVDDLGGDLDKIGDRLKDLENPMPGSCSQGELCIPDGLDVAKSAVAPIVKAICERQVKCCDAGELNYEFGPAIKSAADCEATFADFVKKGYSPYFLNNELVYYIAQFAHGLNNTDILVKANEAGVKACAASIKSVSCTADGEEESSRRCSPGEEPDYACALDKLLIGLEREGDLCDPNGVPECGEGLSCRRVLDNDSCSDESSFGCGNQAGICVPAAKVGERCLDDDECDGELYCNHAVGKCAQRAKVGEACAYVDPSFEYRTPLSSWPYGNGQNTKIDCVQGAICDWQTNKCVAACSQGALCSIHSECPEGTYCSVLSTREWGNSSRGQCTAPAAAGSECVRRWVYDYQPAVGNWTYAYQNECASQVCAYDEADGRDECQPALKTAGTACTVTNGADASCASGWCNTDRTCAASCAECDSEDADCDLCADGHYCDGVGPSSVCKDRIANGSACDQTVLYYSSHLSCSSGFCDLNDTQTCKAKSVLNGACAGFDEQCQDGQFCNAAGSCATPKAVGATCQNDECGPGNYCWDTRNSGNAADAKCYKIDHDLPNGSFCNGADVYCVSGWCKYDPNGGNNNYVCATPIAVGQDCDSDDNSKDGCVEGAFCTYTDESSAGKCKLRATVGKACDPYFNGYDCLAGFGCELRRDSWICSSSSLPEGANYCDGK